MFPRPAASEFPNDNPELHDGLVWACPAPLGRPLATLRLRPQPGPLPRVLGPSWEAAAPSREPESDVSVATPDVSVAAVEAAEAAPSEIPGPEPRTAFGTFVAALAHVAMARGATRAAAALTGLLEHGRLSPGALDEATLETLVARRIVTTAGTHVTAEFQATSAAYRGLLDGTATDLTACGTGTLDGWAADLLALLVNAPSGEVHALRRELRRAGVAAFGLLAVA